MQKKRYFTNHISYQNELFEDISVYENRYASDYFESNYSNHFMLDYFNGIKFSFNFEDLTDFDLSKTRKSFF